MIETQYQVPQVYFEKSRDFQLLSHVYDVIFNYIKTGIDSIYNIPLNQNSDITLIDLVSYTLGFKPKHKYNTNQLLHICNCFMTIMKNKGNIQSIRDTLSILFRAEGIILPNDITIEDCVVEDKDIYGYKYINLYTLNLKNTTLLEDILDYILPAGVLYRIIGKDLGKAGGTDNIQAVNKLTITSRNNVTSVYYNNSNIDNSMIGILGSEFVPQLKNNEPIDITSDDEKLYPETESE